jgi:hypothetical protein
VPYEGKRCEILKSKGGGGCCRCERLIWLKKAVPVFNFVLWIGIIWMPVRSRINGYCTGSGSAGLDVDPNPDPPK